MKTQHLERRDLATELVYDALYVAVVGIGLRYRFDAWQLLEVLDDVVEAIADGPPELVEDVAGDSGRKGGRS